MRTPGWLSLLFLTVLQFASPPSLSAQKDFSPPKTVAEAIARISAEERDRIVALRERILGNTPRTGEAGMEDYVVPVPAALESWVYREKIRFPKEGAVLDMVRIRGGEFLMGSPPAEANRQNDEGPQVTVRVSPFWMARFETTWNLFYPFMFTLPPRGKDGYLSYPGDIEKLSPVDLVASPTTPYTDMSFGMGEVDFPAVCMTHHAANKFCEWLSFQTGHFYRLPTEAEWEYACRAGTTGAFSCPTEALPDHAVVDPEAVRIGYEKVGTRKSNPWGLHDMHGNVMEWCLDQYRKDAYRSWGKGPVVDPLTRPETRHPRVIRGGSWYDPPEEARSARRIPSVPEWQLQDPQLPRSLWYLTDAHWLGFRVVRPLAVPSVDEMIIAWNNSFLDEAPRK